MKNIILNVRNKNWGEIGPNSWVEKQWVIYDDLLVDYSVIFNKKEDNKNVINFNIDREILDIIMKELELAKEYNVKVEAFDGDAWEFIQYINGKEVWKRDVGYIYGLIHLENIARILKENNR